MAKSADRQTVLAQVSWGYHDAIGCYLTLDDTALTTLRADHSTDTVPDADPTTYDPTVAIAGSAGHAYALRADQTIACRQSRVDDETPVFPGQTFTGLIAVSGPFGCALRADQAIACWSMTQAWDGDHYRSQFQVLEVPNEQLSQVSAATGYFFNLFRVCGLRADQTLACWRWAQNDDGELQFREYGPDGQFTEINGNCGVRNNQMVACWNWVWDDASRQEQLQVDTLSGQFTEFSSHPGIMCGLRADGVIACADEFWASRYEREWRRGVSGPPTGTFTSALFSHQAVCGLRTDDSFVCSYIQFYAGDGWGIDTAYL